jgi:hypothetical protein
MVSASPGPVDGQRQDVSPAARVSRGLYLLDKPPLAPFELKAEVVHHVWSFLLPQIYVDVECRAELDGIFLLSF